MSKFGNAIVLPMFIYFDDYGINNPLGSHSKSIFAGYYYFPTVPRYLTSKLNFIFNFVYINSADYKKFGNEVSLHHVVKHLENLENHGVTLNIGGSTRKVFFTLCAVLGDNLGLNSVLGFTKSFNSHSFCRSCRRKKVDTKKDCTEIEDALRNPINYAADLEINNPKQTGIVQNSVFNKVPSFHVTQNFIFDVMHDLFEGICVYDICNVLVTLIQTQSISLDTINSRKALFQYGETEVGYMSQPLDFQKLQSFQFKMSARESWSFIHFLPLFIGDLISPNSRPWKLICLLLEIIDLLLLPEFSLNDVQKLKNVIQQHNQLYIQLYGDLKPKHHFLVHYPTLILKCGPPKFIWGFRFESKHRPSKIYSSNTTSRVNIPYSLAVKAGLKYSKFLLDFKDGIDADKFDFCKSKTISLDNIDLSETDLSNDVVKELRSLSATDSVTYCGRKYKSGFYLTVFENNNNTRLFRIVHLVNLNSLLYVLCYQIQLKRFDVHFQAFEVGHQLDFMLLKRIDSFSSPPLHVYALNNGKVYLRNKFL